MTPKKDMPPAGSVPAPGAAALLSVEGLFAEALREHQAGRLAEAEALYRQALARDSRHADSLHLAGVVAYQRGRAGEAAEMIARAIATNPGIAAYHSNLGTVLHDLGQLEESAAACRQALALQPNSAEAQYNLGNALRDLDRLDEALAAYRSATALKPDYFEAHYNLGDALAKHGRQEEAIACYRQALALKPDSIDVRYNLGVAWQELGRPEDAAPIFAELLGRAPNHAAAAINLGNALRELGRQEDALEAYGRALAAEPGSAEAQYHLGLLHYDRRELEAAAACFGAAISQRPDLVPAHTNLATVLYELGRWEESARSSRAALAIKPDDAYACITLGNALRELGRREEAIACFRQAVLLDPGIAESHNNLGNALQELGRLEEAIPCYRQAITLRPNYAEAHSNLGNTLQLLGRMDEAVAWQRRALALRPDYAPAASNLQMALQYGTATGAEEILAEARRFAASVERHARPTFANTRDPERRLRIGYVSGNFHHHPVGYFLLPALVSHDHQRFEVLCYANSGRIDEMTERLRGTVEQWRSIVGLPDERVADLIRDDGIDILVDLSGHTELNRLPLFARKPAPVQASWLGYWATTGLSTMDYIISDAVTVPPGEERWYSERVTRLEGIRFCYAPPEFAPAPAAEPPSARNGYVTFGSFNNLAKVGPEVIRLWAAVLQAVPGSHVLLKWRSLVEPATRERIAAAFAAEGIPAERLELRGHSGHAEMLGEYADMDVALDPFPFSGGLTSCEALWMGVPVVTLPQQNAPSRQTLGFLQAIGKPEWAAGSPEEYVRIAAALAAGESGRAALRQALRPAMAASPLCDGPLFAKRLEAAYRDMWRRWCSA